MVYFKSFFKKLLKKIWMIKVVSYLIFIYLRIVYRIAPTKYMGVDKLKQYVAGGKPVILVFWHSRSMFMPKFWDRNLGFKKHKIYGVFSTHSDGRIIGEVFNFFGCKNILSNSKSKESGRQVLLKSLRALRLGISIGLTPDGPLGPPQEFSTDSVFLFSKSSGVPVVPISISCSNGKFLNTWDRWLFIKPFSKVIVDVGDFVFVPRDADMQKISEIRESLTNVMNEKLKQLDEYTGIYNA